MPPLVVVENAVVIKQLAVPGRKGTFDKAERVESAFALLSGK